MPLRALLIAIDQYHPDSRVLPLAGCRNDVATVRDFLQKYFQDQIRDEKDIRLLVNQEAVRENVIRVWQEHLGQAQPGDTVLIYFSGHGSRSKTANEFHGIELDGWEEGWVLYDSRLPGRFDLADKEIALLLEITGRNNPDIVVISDSCHSGSVTRDAEEFMGWKVRYTPGTKEPRPLKTYLNGEYAKQWAAAGALNVPYTRHLSFSACKNTEKALESDEKYGAFTHALLTAAERSGAQISYSDLFTRACAEIRSITRQQNPQIAAYLGFNPHTGLLGKPLPAKNQRRYPMRFDTELNDWRIELGVDTGLRADMNQEIEVELYKAATGGEKVGKITLAQLNISKSSIHPGETKLSKYDEYWGVPLSLPLAPLCVYCAEEQTTQTVQAELDKLGENAIVLLEQPQGCPVGLRFAEGKFSLYSTGTENLICRIDERDKEANNQLLRTLDQIAHWHRILSLENPASKLAANKLELELFIQGKDGQWQLLDGKDFTLSIGRNSVDFKIAASNQSDRPLHMALVYLSPRYGMQAFAESSTSPMPAGTSEFSLLETHFHLPEHANEELDHFKLIVSTEPIDPTAFSREDLEPDRSGPTGQKQLRSIGGLTKSDWLVKSIQVRLLRDAADGTAGERPLRLAGGQITLQPHPTLRSAYRLTVPASTRGLDAVSLEHPFFRTNPIVQTLPWTATRGADASYLDLTDIQSDYALAGDPWQIDLKPGDADSLVLPFWFDGNNFLPLGETIVKDDGALAVQLRHIPSENEAVRTRSLGKALRLYAFRFAKDLGLPLHTQYLRWVEYRPDGSFERHSEGLAERVGKAKTITLLIHGIAGDTKNMAAIFRSAGLQADGLVLSFDYENLKTPVEDTALALKKMLTENAALNGKKLHIVAHSLGGLVARYFIEHLNGHSFTERLIMTGVPNAGSNLGNVPDYLNWASGMLGIGMKYFQWNLPAIAGLVSALQFAKNELLITLKQMKPGSDLLKRLAEGGPPPVPYRVIAGDIRKMLAMENTPDFSDKLLTQIGRWAYGAEPNDGAVSVESVFSVQAAVKDTVAGHHWGYYEDNIPGL